MLLIAVLTAVIMLSMGCGNASHTKSRTVTDMKGRDVVLNGDVTRVVVLTAADCEILYAIGAGDTVVGRGENTATIRKRCCRCPRCSPASRPTSSRSLR